ncbi:MAG TPA: hypothetical protein VG937_07190 [Polyangiaceae bacterium]|nr:hypothetical protein [Polyangiaceae bacterium]
MYACAVDEDSTTLVGAYAGQLQRDEDYERCIESILNSDGLAADRSQTHVCVLVTTADVARPPPIWRRRMADANNALRAEEYYFALVAPSVLVRGVFTAINWLTRPRAGYHLAAFEHFSQAADWVRVQTGKPYPQLERLYATARTKLAEEPESRTSSGPR